MYWFNNYDTKYYDFCHYENFKLNLQQSYNNENQILLLLKTYIYDL